MKKRSVKLIVTLFTLSIVLILSGASFAVFSYYKELGTSLVAKGSKISMNVTKYSGDLGRIEPVSDAEAKDSSYTDSVFTITGYNESNKDIYYCIDLTSAINGSALPDNEFKIELKEVIHIGNSIYPAKTLIDAQQYDNIRKLDLYYGKIPKNTSSSSPISITYHFKLWLGDQVWFTDSDDTIDPSTRHLYSTSVYNNLSLVYTLGLSATMTLKQITYDVGESTMNIQPTSVIKGVTHDKPYISGKVFMGWDSNGDGIVDYFPGDSYGTSARTLTAVYTTGTCKYVNVFNPSLSTAYFTKKGTIDKTTDVKHMKFIYMKESEALANYNSHSIGAKSGSNSTIPIYCWFEDGTYYVASEGTIESYAVSGQQTDVSIFMDMHNMISIDLENFDRPNYLYCMFKNCYSLSSIDFSHVQFSRTLISFMFYSCKSLKEFNGFSEILSGSRNVTNTSYMFEGCTSLKKVKLTGFNNSNNTDMRNMFSHCSSLEYLDFSGLDINREANCMYMCQYCSSLKEARFPVLNHQAIANAGFMFRKCTNLVKTNIDVLDLSNNINMSNMFSYASSLKELNFAGIETSSLCNLDNTFSYTGFRNIDLTEWNFSSVTTMIETFFCCPNLESVNLSNSDLYWVGSMKRIFAGSTKLKYVNLKGSDFRNVTNMSYFASSCASLEEINLDDCITGDIRDLSYAFDGCTNLKKLNTSILVGDRLSTLQAAFRNARSLEYIDLSNLNNSYDNCSITLYAVFSGCSNVKTIKVPDLSRGYSITSLYSAFYNCSNLVRIYSYEPWDYVGSSVSQINIFQGCDNLIGQGCSRGSTTTYNRMHFEQFGKFTDIRLEGMEPKCPA